uniref:Uncharacterized protein n=1 Tax=Anguilla anguilla TaxID=7936 RepID=A0A0E9PS70_ANGAN
MQRTVLYRLSAPPSPGEFQV